MGHAPLTGQLSNLLPIPLSVIISTLLNMDGYQTRLNLAIDPFNAAVDTPGKYDAKIRALATRFEVVKTTLVNRINGFHTSHCVNHAHLQALLKPEEDVLVDYIRHTSIIGHPPT